MREAGEKAQEEGGYFMRFALNRPVKIVMLGAGGTGGHIAPHLYRLLHALDRPVKVIIVDGDIVEGKNLVRQNFIAADLGRNKAQVLAERYASAFGMEAQYIPEFVESEETLSELVKPECLPVWMDSGKYPQELPILIGAVDNNRSRQLCHQVFQKSEELVYIDSGNGEYTGQVVCGIRRGGKTSYKPVGEIYPDVLDKTDKFPTELSCAEAAVSAPQSITANIMAAAAVVAYIYNILVLGSIEVKNVTFSTRTVNLKPVLSGKRKEPENQKERRHKRCQYNHRKRT